MELLTPGSVPLNGDTRLALRELNTVRRVMALLDAAGAPCWLFGGWAEELRGLRAQGAHGDIDLLYPAPSFAAVDSLLAAGRVVEIEAKRFLHKRAFLFDGVMSELLLAARDERGLFTMFWGAARHDWPDDGLLSPAGFEWPVASARALRSFRRDHERLVSGRDTYLARLSDT